VEAGSREWVTRYLDGVLADAQAQLAKLRAPEAWRCIEVTFDMPCLSPAFGGLRDEQERALGPEYRVIKARKRPYSDLPAHRKLLRIADTIERTEGVSRPQAVMLAFERNPPLHKQHVQQARRNGGSVEECKPRRLAKLAAVANAALQRLDDPAVAFRSGAYIEQHRMVEVLRRNLTGKARETALKLIEKHRSELRKRGASGGAKGAGNPKSDHGKLLQRIVEIERACVFEDVLKCLQDEDAVEKLIGQAPELDMHYVQYKESTQRMRYETGSGDEQYVSRAALERAFNRINSRAALEKAFSRINSRKA